MYSVKPRMTGTVDWLRYAKKIEIKTAAD